MGSFSFIGVAALVARAEAAAVDGVEQITEDFIGKAQAAETAVVSGTLRGSITTDGVQASGREVSAKVYTGGESSAYAAYIHEGHRADGSHPIGEYPGGLKYLERPLIENRGVYVEVMARALRGRF